MCVCAQYLGVSGDDGDTSGSGLFPKNEAMTHLGRYLGTGETAIRPGGEGGRLYKPRNLHILSIGHTTHDYCTCTIVIES